MGQGRVKRVAAWAGLFAPALALAPGTARADFLAGWVAGQGALGNVSSTQDAGLSPGVGAQVGARLFLLEAYGEMTSFLGQGNVMMVIGGLQVPLEIGRLRLTLRAGGGALRETNGILSAGDRTPGTVRDGGVARAGVEADWKLGKGLSLGPAVDAQWFALSSTADRALPATTGSAVFGSVRLKFELGI